MLPTWALSPCFFKNFIPDSDKSINNVLFGIGEIEKENKGLIVKNEDDVRIINKLIQYLNSIEYWHDFDSGMWEEDEEVHASSIGACVAGLKSIQKVKGSEIKNNLIEKGEKILNKLLPRESKKKFVDLALLSLIYPYNIVNKKQEKEILENIEYYLLKERGVVRYKNDYYYNKNSDGYSQEAEWTFGFAWLAIIYEKNNQIQKAEKLLIKLNKLSTDNGLPELYFSHSKSYNQNTPLGWTKSLFIIALNNIHKKHKPTTIKKIIKKVIKK